MDVSNWPQIAIILAIGFVGYWVYVIIDSVVDAVVYKIRSGIPDEREAVPLPDRVSEFLPTLEATSVGNPFENSILVVFGERMSRTYLEDVATELRRHYPGANVVLAAGPGEP